MTLLTDPAKMREHGQMMLEGSSKGLLGDPEPIQEVVSEGEAAREPDGQGDQPCVPPAQPARGQRVSAFW